MQHMDFNFGLHGNFVREAKNNAENESANDMIDTDKGATSEVIGMRTDGATRIPLIRRGRHREELEYDLLLVLLWVSKNVPSSMFEQVYTLIWNFTRLDDEERDRMLTMMRELGDARFGPGRDAQSPA